MHAWWQKAQIRGLSCIFSELSSEGRGCRSGGQEAAPSLTAKLAEDDLVLGFFLFELLVGGLHAVVFMLQELPEGEGCGGGGSKVS